jgi:hypothetical protein
MCEVNGVIKSIGDIQQISEKFKKRELVIKTNEDYPQDLLFELTQSNCELLDNLVVGQTVNASFNLRGKEYQKKDGSGLCYFNSLQIWKINLVGSEETKNISTFAEKLKNKTLNSSKPMGNIEANFAEAEIDALNAELEDDDLAF